MRCSKEDSSEASASGEIAGKSAEAAAGSTLRASPNGDTGKAFPRWSSAWQQLGRSTFTPDSASFTASVCGGCDLTWWQQQRPLLTLPLMLQA